MTRGTPTNTFECFSLLKFPGSEWVAVATDDCSTVPHGAGNEDDLKQMADLIERMNRIRTAQEATGQPIDDLTVFRQLLEAE